MWHCWRLLCDLVTRHTLRTTRRAAKLKKHYMSYNVQTVISSSQKICYGTPFFVVVPVQPCNKREVDVVLCLAKKIWLPADSGVFRAICE